MDYLARLMMFVAIGYLAVGLSAQEPGSSTGADDLPLIKPTATLDLPQMNFYYPLAAKSDSSDSVIAYTSLTVINVWSLAVYYWPEILGIISIAVLLLMSLWRLRHRRLIVGQPHCRKCHYSLIAFEGDKCPECGVELTERNRITGRRMRWRLGVYLGLMTLILGGYLSSRHHLPRQGWFADQFEILSSRVNRWLANQNEIRRPHLVYLQRIVEIDVATGRLNRTIRTHSGRRIDPEFSLDRKVIFIRHGQRSQIYDIESGKCLADRDMLELAGKMIDYDIEKLNNSIMGESPGQLYFITQQGSLQWWNLVDGVVEELAQLENQITTLYVIPDTNHLGLLTSYDQNGWEWQEFDLQSRQIDKTIRSINGRNMHHMLLSSDGTRIVLCEKDTTSLELWDRAAGGMIGEFEFPQSPLQPQYAPMAMSDDHRWILAGESKGMGNLNAGGAMYVFDTIRGTLAAKLDVSMISGAQIAMLPDNKTVVLLGGGLQGTQKKLYTYDLSQLTTD